jgi:ketosteroid isomerase-like protein
MSTSTKAKVTIRTERGAEMKLLHRLALIPFVLMSGPAQADETLILDVPKAAEPAVACVDRFSAALSAGNLDRAAAELDSDLIVLESGGAEYSAAEYLGGHAKYDAEFLKLAKVTPVRRTARTSGTLAWVASESEIRAEKDGKPEVILSAETMVLQSTDAGWKIVHIHWSSRLRNTG